jgi:hypothetical protein
LIGLQRFDEARQIIREGQLRNMDNELFHLGLYAIAFDTGGSAQLDEQNRWFAGHPEFESDGLALGGDTEAYHGHLGKSRELTRKAVESAIRNDSKEGAAIYLTNAAVLEAAFGFRNESIHMANQALQLSSASLGVSAEAALAFAISGENARAESMARELGKLYGLNMQVQSLWLPSIRAQLALNRNEPAAALRELEPALPVELGSFPFLNNGSCLYHTYIRGEAYLAAGQGSAAAAEFQKILDHSGIVWNCWTGAVAHLGLARANSMEAKTASGANAAAARERALGAYNDFFALWKDAESNIPFLKDAKAEYRGLQ